MIVPKNIQFFLFIYKIPYSSNFKNGRIQSLEKEIESLALERDLERELRETVTRKLQDETNHLSQLEKQEFRSQKIIIDMKNQIEKTQENLSFVAESRDRLITYLQNEISMLQFDSLEDKMSKLSIEDNLAQSPSANKPS